MNFPLFKKSSLIKIIMKTKHRVVILGGTGFIGNSLSGILYTNDNIELSIIHKNPLIQNKFPGVKYYQTDVTKQDKKLGKVISNIDCLVILSQPQLDLINNIITFSSKIKKIIYASTLLLYPDSPHKQDEDSLLKPINNYEKSKLKEEQLLQSYAKTHNTKLCIVRLTNVYGNVKNRGIVQKIFTAILNNEQLTINGSGNQLRDYTFIEDVINPLQHLILSSQNKSVEIFNICSGEAHTLNEVISIIEEITGKKLKRVKGEAIKEKTMIIGDNTKIVRLSRIKPQFNLREGLTKTYYNNLKDIKPKLCI